MKLKLAVCIFVAVFLSAVFFKVNQVEYIPEYDSGGKSLQAVNSENITEIKTEAEPTTNEESKKDNTVRIVILNNNYINKKIKERPKLKNVNSIIRGLLETSELIEDFDVE